MDKHSLESATSIKLLGAMKLLNVLFLLTLACLPVQSIDAVKNLLGGFRSQKRSLISRTGKELDARDRSNNELTI